MLLNRNGLENINGLAISSLLLLQPAVMLRQVFRYIDVEAFDPITYYLLIESDAVGLYDIIVENVVK